MIIQCPVSGHFKMSVRRVYQLFHFIFIKLTILHHKKRVFFSSKFSIKFKKFAQFDLKKRFHNFSNNMLFIVCTENSHKMKPKHLSPLATYCPITGPSLHVRQLLDSGTWHQQQLKQLAAFLTPQHTVVYFTAGINSLLHRNT